MRQQPLLVLLILSTILIIPSGSSPVSAQGCGLCDLAGRIERGELINTVRELSGSDSVVVDGSGTLISTRSTLLPEKLLARDYLLDRVAGLGYSAIRQPFSLSVYYPDLLAAEVSVTGDTLWVGSDEGEVLLMTSGEGWNSATVISRLDMRIYDLELDSRGRLWAAGKTQGAGYGELHYSDDGGANWQAKIIGNLTNNIRALNSIVFSSPDAAVVSGSYGTAFRMQHVVGEWFIATIDPAELLYRQLQGSAASGPAHIWIVSSGGAIFESNDLGAAWTYTSPSSDNLWDIDFCGPYRGIAVGDGQVCYTDDGGVTWNRVSIGADFFTVTMLDTLEAVAAGVDGAVWTTSDGGASWSQVAYDCPRDDNIRETVVAVPDGIWAVGGNMPLMLDLDGMEVGCRQWELADTIWGENIIFGSEGQSYPGEKVIVCAHYDSRNWQDPYCAPGADDNASGCAGVLEIARVFADAAFERSVEFALFDGEETGLLGSRYYVAQRDTFLEIEAVINLDMIGRDYGGGVTVDIAGREDPVDSALAAMIIGMASFLDLDLDCNYLYTSSPTSDHKAFWEIDGVPAILLIENEYHNNPHYHACTDVADNIDYDFMTGVVMAAAGSAAQLAGLIRTDPLPASVVLHQNFPNPLFNHTRIRFELPSRLQVDLTLFDLTGRPVVVMIRDSLDEGRHEYAWDGRGTSGEAVESGVYFLRLRAGSTDRVRKVVIVR
jgi:photosystem II stability/assembly factor-like uncharacterized protein